MHRIVPFGLLLVLGLVVAPALAQDILIGHYGAMTGNSASFGISTDEGIRLALDGINAGGGILGKQVKVVTADTQGRPEEAVTAVNKLINQDKVVAVLGEVASSNSMAAAPVCQRARIPMLSPASTNPKVTQLGDYIFRSCFIDPFQGPGVARFAMDDLKVKKFAVFYDVKQAYSTGLREVFIKAVKDAGGEIVADESYASEDVDFKAQLTKIRNTNPEAIFMPGYYTEAGLVFKQAKELGLNVPFLGCDGWDSAETLTIAGAAGNGNYFSTHYSPEEDRPAVKKFVDAYKAKYNGKTPDAMAILGYDAMNLMADAITRAKGTRGRDIRDALKATKDFPGASGTFSIDADRNAKKQIVILKIENEATKFVKSVAP
jgi:branched-chain amino acid transport system substrate-binding protein